MNEDFFEPKEATIEFTPGLTQDAFLNTCVRSKMAVDVFIENHQICNCRILSHDQRAIMVRLNGKVALLYKNAIQAIVPEGGSRGGGSADYSHILADVRSQYMRHLTQNRAGRAVKGN